ELVCHQKSTEVESPIAPKENDQDMIKTFIGICLLLNLAMSVSAEEQHALFTSVLKKYVHNGRVNYKELRNDPDLGKYISFLESSNPENFTNDKERLAFWINAYNAYTLKIICDHYPVKSINDLHSGGKVVGTVFKTTIWDTEIVVIN